jgi:hypothetical protein
MGRGCSRFNEHKACRIMKTGGVILLSGCSSLSDREKCRREGEGHGGRVLWQGNTYADCGGENFASTENNTWCTPMDVARVLAMRREVKRYDEAGRMLRGVSLERRQGGGGHVVLGRCVPAPLMSSVARRA